MRHTEEDGRSIEGTELDRFRNTGEDRDDSAGERDRKAVLRDQRSEVRDDHASARDLDAEARREVSEATGAASDRAAASRDRKNAARDRDDAAADRQAAWVDRAESADERLSSSMDEVTGAYRRGAGLAELKREILRAGRREQPLTLAFVDVDSLKTVNDSLGHAAGDQLLREVAELLRNIFRPYDLIMRYGGDEFVCAFSDMELGDAKQRFTLVNDRLAPKWQTTVSAGIATLERGDEAGTLIARADRDMYEQRDKDKAPSKGPQNARPR